MPNLDGTGPQGRGPMSGRGFGNCPGRRGFGRRFRNFNPFCPFARRKTLSKEEQKEILLAEKKEIEEILAELDQED